MKQLFLKTTLLFLLITSCELLEEPTQVYYNFEKDDFNKLLSLKLNNFVKYENQFGENIVYEVINVSEKFKNQRTKGNWVTSTINELFFYDKKEVELKNNSKISSIDYRFLRYPINDLKAEENEYKKFPSEFYGTIYFSFWNGINDYGSIDINYKNIKVNLLINGKNYENVIIIKSNNNNPLSNSTSERSVNVIYYDTEYGIIGFDDLENKKWRIEN